jgi:hypothetical protein
MKILNNKSFLLVLITFAIISCSKKPEDIKLSDLKSSCDYVDALEIVIDEGLLLFKNKKIEELSPEEHSYLQTLKTKLNDIGEAAEKKFTISEVRECSKFKLLDEKMEKFKQSLFVKEEVVEESVEENILLENKIADITFYKGEWTNNTNTCNDEIARQENLIIKYDNSTKKFIIAGWEWYGIINSIKNDEFTILGFSEDIEFTASYKFSSEMENLKFKFIEGDFDMIGIKEYYKCK